ncbi:MAG: uracil-DNA glycosylase [Fusobacteriota bacterium]
MNELYEDLIFEIETCKKCPLHKKREKVVPGEGNLKSPIMFIAEAPGEDENKEGKPFVGKSGKLLTKIFDSVDLSREDVYITNMIKCHPDGNRAPKENEIESCYPFLETQIALINPKVIVTVGGEATNLMIGDQLGKKDTITTIRGRIFDWEGEIKVIPILHPSYLLRQGSTKKGSPKWNTWQDMKKIKKIFDKYNS